MPESAARDRPFLLGAVVLAAGGSSRMGSVKQLLEVEGKTFVARAVDAALASQARPIAVVVGANAREVLSAVVDRAVIAVHNPDWAEGIASSIRAGMAALVEAEPALDAVLIAPCDPPGLSAQVINSLATLHRSTGLISASRYAGRNGAPAVFGRDLFAALAALSGDEGARGMLNSGARDVASLDLPELACDIDTPSDYSAWKKR
jgi:molybdenum cofactor cytidylyltransferase